MGKVVKTVIGIGTAIVGVVTGNPWLIAAGLGIAFSDQLVPEVPEVSGNEATNARLGRNVDPEARRKIVFGNTLAGMDQRYWEETNNEEAYHEVIALASHRIQSIGAFYINGEVCSFDGNGNITSPSDYVVPNINIFSGGGVTLNGVLKRRAVTEGAAGNALTVGSGSYWNSSTSRFTGCAYLALSWVYDEDGLPRGVPSKIKQRVEGALVYDPRKDSTRGGSGSHRADDQTTWEYAPLDSNGVPIGRNNALQMLWYQIGWRIEGTLVCGKGVDLEDIDFDAFIQAANDCETMGWYSDGTLDTGDGHKKNESIIAAAAGGMLSDSGGVFSYRVAIDDTATITQTFGPGDMLSQIKGSPRRPMSQQYNVVVGTYVDPASGFQRRPLPVEEDAAYIAADGFRRRKSFSLDMVQDSEQGQKLLRLYLNKSRMMGEYTVTVRRKATRVLNHDLIRIDFPDWGWSNRLFRVTNVAFAPGGGINISFRDEDAAVYSFGTVSPLPAPATLPGGNPHQKYPVSNPVATPTTFTSTTGGTKTDGIAVVFDEPSRFVTQTQVRIRKDGETQWQNLPPLARGETEIVVESLRSGTDYEMEVRHLNQNGVKGDWVLIEFTTGTEAISLAAVEAADPTLRRRTEWLTAATYNAIYDPMFRLGTGLWLKDDETTLAFLEVSESDENDRRVLVQIFGAKTVGLVYNRRMPVSEGDRIEFSCEAAQDGTGGVSGTPYLDWYNSSGTLLSSTSLGTLNNDFLRDGGFGTAPANAHRCALRIEITTTGDDEFRMQRPFWRIADPGQTVLTAFDEGLVDQVNQIFEARSVQAGLASLQQTLEVADADKSARIDTETQARIDGDGALASQITTVEATANSRISTFFQDAAPTANAVGDLWYDTDDRNRVYRWDGASWVDARDVLLTETNASVVINANAIATIEGAAAYYSVITAATGSTNAVVELRAGDLGSRFATVADQLVFLNYDGTGSPTVAMAIESGTLKVKGDILLDSLNGAISQPYGLGETRFGSLGAGKYGLLIQDHLGVTRLRADQDGLSLDGVIVTDGTISAAKLAVSSLSAITGSMGTLTVDSALTMNTGGHIKGGMTGYATGAGFWMGYDSTAYKFSIGNATNYIRWDGATLAITGSVSITGDLSSISTTTGALTVSDVLTLGASGKITQSFGASGELSLGDLGSGRKGLRVLNASGGEAIYVDDLGAARLNGANWSTTVDDDGNRPDDGATRSRVFRQPTAPTSPTVNDIWYDTDDPRNRVYKWSGSVWEVIATFGASWDDDLYNRPGWTTDGRVPAGFDANGDLIRNISLAILNGSNVLRWTGGGLFSGALNANYITNTNELSDGANLGGTAAWSGVTSRPTELTDGRITTALDASGILLTNLSALVLSGSNIMTRGGGGGNFVGDLNATNGAAWGTNLTGRPANLTALVGTENINNAGITISSSGVLSGAGGGTVTITGLGYTGDLNANFVNNTNQLTDGAGLGTTAAWGSVSSRPTELTDGRIAAGLDASGDLVRNITTARANSSGLLRYTGGGLYSGALNANYITNTNELSDGANLGGTAVWSGVTGTGKPADNATVGAAWGTNITGRPDELTDGRIAAALNDEGHINSDVKIVQASGTALREMPRAFDIIQVQDGDSVSFGTNFDEVPRFFLVGGAGATYNKDLSGTGLGSDVTQVQNFQAQNPSVSGCTIKAKIKTVPTGTTLRSDSMSTAGSGGQPERMGDKSVTEDAADGTYTFEIDHQYQVTGVGGEPCGINVTVQCYIDSGSGMVQVASQTKWNQHATSGTYTASFSIPVASTITGQPGTAGSNNREWGYTVSVIKLGGTGSLSSDSYLASTVDYESVATVTEEDATPGSEKINIMVMESLESAFA